MRITRRVVPVRWERGLWLAMSVMAGLVLAVGLTLRTAPAAAHGAETPAIDSSPAKVIDPVNFSQPDVASQMLPARVPALMQVRLADTAEIRHYQGRRFQLTATMALHVTAYAPDRRCTFPYPGTTTASGLPVSTNGGHLVATDPAVIPAHWLVVVPGYAGGQAVPVLDRGGAIKGARVDVLLPTFAKAQEWGVRVLKVRVYRPVD